MPPHVLRRAEPRDLHAIVALIGELAEFERLTHLLQVTPESLAPHLFGELAVAECVVGEVGAEVHLVVDRAFRAAGGHGHHAK